MHHVSVVCWCVAEICWQLLKAMSSAPCAAMGNVAADNCSKLSTAERAAVATAVTVVLMRCQMERSAGRLKAQLRARRRKAMQALPVAGLNTAAICEAVFQVCCTMGCGGMPKATPRWWVKRRKGGTWEDLRPADDDTEEYFHDKLRMSPCVFREITENLLPFLQRRVTFYREPLQPDHIVAYALATGVVAVRDVTAALLAVYREKVSWPTGVRQAVVLRAFVEKGFPNCHDCIDCTHIYIDKSTNAPGEDYFDKKRRFSVVAQVVVDLDLRVMDVFVGYLGSYHDVRVIHLSSLWARAEPGELFTGPPVMLPFQVQTSGYLLGDNGYPSSEWIVVPYGGTSQQSSELRFDNKQKTARWAVERTFGRLKGMWRLFLRSHKTNMETLPQQFAAVCILHNILIDVGIPFDDNLLWEVDANRVQRRVDLGIQRPPGPPVCMDSSTGDALILRDALAERMSVR
ncbi:hypothetical protein CBR_g40078 [Chara braunii]|uniref:DDE Tnp4 domain-containing protein n=1 Tax=Chara braunii TaxID=69332 RepID=A0A388LSY4_CHABU|nr:hypothetical protein CBR_g40078 [Chara braunii]|eukprot:GBG85436.1 hypothetical protein CBR_g40078 [Chara braunii]